MNVFLREPIEEDKEEVIKMCHELVECRDQFPFEGCTGLKVVLIYSFEEWLKGCEIDKNIEKIYSKGSNTTNYLLVDDSNHIYGFSQFRPKLNENTIKVGGNISYAIRPTERGKGYGKYQLKLLVEKAKEAGLDKVLVTCRENNEKSFKVIHSFKVEEDTMVPSYFPNIMERRFWIHIN